MRKIRRSLAAKVLVGWLVLLLAVIASVSATFLISRDRDARSAAAAMADDRAAVARHLLGQTTGVASSYALSRIVDNKALTDLFAANPPQTARAALEIIAADTRWAGTAIVVVDRNGQVMFSHSPVAGAGMSTSWAGMTSIREAIGGRAAEGVDLVGSVPAYVVTMPLRRGGHLVGAAAALTLLNGEVRQYASTTGYPTVLVTAADPTRLLSATPATAVESVTPAALITAIVAGDPVARATESRGTAGDDRLISLVAIRGVASAAPVVYLGVEVPLRQFTGGAHAQADDVVSVALIALLATLVTTLMFIWFVSTVVRRPLGRLERAVARISDGDYSVEIPVTSEDELGRLATSVNRMRLQVAGTVHTMEVRANTDSQTRLFNSRFLFEHLRREGSSAIRHGAPLAVLMVDIDHFKSVNDRYGHPAGDCALVAVATSIAASIRESDVAARYGGEEFALVLPHTDREQALVAAEKIRAAVAAEPVDLGDGNRCVITVSIGAASYPQDCVSPDALIDLADAALYEAKNRGRNRVCAAESPNPAAPPDSEPEARLTGVPRSVWNHGRIVRRGR